MTTTPAQLKTYEFTVTLAGMPAPDPGLDDRAWDGRMAELLDELSGRAIGAGLEDAGLCGAGSTGDQFHLSFALEAESLGLAIGRAVEELERAGFTVARVDVGA
jgi:hypothetical protein